MVSTIFLRNGRYFPYISIVKLLLIIVIYTNNPLFNFVLAQTIVLDAGHGGKDDGCTGNHSTEKHITLSLAHRTQQEIMRLMPQARVVLTRDSDEFVSLKDRSNLANSVQADLFLSLHCNHHDVKSVSGCEIYVLGEDSYNYNRKLSERENNEKETSTVCFTQEFNYHKYQETLTESILFASMVNRWIVTLTDLSSRSIREASFKVLCGLDMPGVLIESAFISNLHDEEYMMSELGQSSFAKALAQGIYQYFEDIQVTQTFAQTNHPSYALHIATTKNKEANTSRSEWAFIENYTVYTDETFYYYLYGNYRTAREAEEHKSRLEKYGFTGTTVVLQDQYQTFEKIK